MSHAIVEALGWALVHSLWQCAAAASAYAVFHLLARGANARYVAGCAAMLAMFVAPAVTFSSFLNTPSYPSVIASVPGAAAVHAVSSSDSDLPPETVRPAAPIGVTRGSGISEYLPFAVWMWITGVIALSVWETGAWVVAQRIKRRSRQALPHIWQAQFSALCERMGVRRVVAAYQSSIAKVPAVIGCLRPVVLVPAGALINLSAQELEAILAHELAHVRRFDYLANLLQTAIETLLFYHPAVWWVGNCLRVEREHCCDDLAVQACGDRLAYARALTCLEELRCAAPHAAVAATGGVLSQRIHRLLGKPQPLRRSLPVWLLGALTFLLSIILVDNTRTAHANQASTARVTVAHDRFSPQPAPFAADPNYNDETPAPAAPASTSPVVAVSARTPATTPPFAPPQAAPVAPTPAPDAVVLTAPALQAVSAPHAAAAPRIAAAQTPAPAPPAAAAPQTPGPGARTTSHGDGFLAGLADAGYTNISVEEIIELKQNGVKPAYIKDMLQAGFGTLTPRQLIALHANSVPPEYARAVKTAGIRDLKVEDVIRMRQNGVRADLVEGLASAGYKDVTVAQVIDAQNNGISGSTLRSVRDQGFKNLTLEQVIKLKRAGVI